MRRLIAFALLFIAAAARSADAPCDPDKAPENCTLRQAIDFYREQSSRSTAVTAKAVDETNAKVTNSNRATTPPDAFAGRVHNSYQDFLNLFSFAINKVDESENGQALTVRFNPLREGASLLGFTLTASKPTLADAVTKAIPEAGRDDVVKKLNAKLNDLDDLTYAGSYSWQTPECTSNTTNPCFGRSAETYRDLLSYPFAAIAAQVAFPELTAQRHELLEKLIPQFTGKNIDKGVLGMNMTEAKDLPQLRKDLKELAINETAQTADEKAAFSKINFAAVSSMVDNQPQLSATASYRTPGTYGGSKQTAMSLEFNWGPDNLNKVRRACKGDMSCFTTTMLQRMDKGVKTDKFVATATYTRNADYHLTDLGLDAAVPGFIAIDQRSSSELKVKAQAGRQFGMQVSGQNMRADFSLEGHRVENDRARTTNRWVATWTVTVPLAENISVPVSVVYANKPEFLEGTDRRSAHIGISYRLPFAKQTGPQASGRETAP